MNALFVYNYPLIFDASSPDRARMRAYAAAIGELHVLSPLPAASEEQDGPLHLHGIRTPRLMRPFALASRARALILEHGIEVVSAHDPFEQGYAALRAVRGTNAKLHVQLHTDPFSPWFVKSGNWRSPQVRMPFLNSIRRRLADKVLPKAAGICTVSKRVKDSLIVRYGTRIKEPSIIPVAVSSTVQPKVALPANPFAFSLIAASRLEPEKRIEDILAALALVVPHYPSAGLFIAGEGRERARLEKMARMLKLEKHVVFLGWRTDAQGLMQSAQAFIQASAYEGYGMTFVEAALAKVPIITTDVGIIGEVFKGYDDVLAAPVADPTALSLHIVGLIEDMRVRFELPRHAQETALAHLASQPADHAAAIAADLAKVLAA